MIIRATCKLPGRKPITVDVIPDEHLTLTRVIETNASVVVTKRDGTVITYVAEEEE